jgi:serine/threonine-protein kinase
MAQGTLIVPGFGPESGNFGKRPGPVSRRTSALARRRLGQLALLLAGLSTIFAPIYGALLFHFANPSMTKEVLLIALSGLTLDLAMVGITKDAHVSDDGVVRFGIIYQTLRVALLALPTTRLVQLMGFDPSAITLGHCLVVLFVLFVPLTPARTLSAAVFGAATQPLVMVAFSPRPLHGEILFNAWIASVIVAILAVICGRVTYGLRTRATHGAELGAYHLVELLHREPMREVWRGTHRLLARPAAIHTIRPSLRHRTASRAAVQRFEDDAQAAALLTSPHTVTLYDYGVSDDGGLYHACQLVGGDDLGARVRRRGPLSPPAVVEMALQLCESLEEAHGLGLLHRDLRPLNVRLCEVGLHADFVKVTGFGIAAMAHDLEGTNGGSDPEKAACVPPEVGRGQPSRVQSDVYQVGCLLHFALTGVSDAVAARSGTGIRNASLRKIVKCCTRDDASERYASVAELVRALQAVRGVEEGEDRESQLESGLLALDTTIPLLGPRSEGRSSAATIGDRPTVADFSAWESPQEVVKAPLRVAPEVLEGARRRLATLALGTGILSALLLLGSLTAPSMHRPEVLAEVLPAFGAGLSLDLALVFAARDRNLATGAVMSLAVGYFVLRSFVFSFGAVGGFLVTGGEPPLMTFTPLLVLVLPLFVLKPPRQLLVPAILAAAAQPLALVLVTPPDLPTLWPLSAFLSGMAALASQVVAYLLSGLQLSASREPAFGSYRLVKRIGEGAVGEVWRAEHELLARPAAIKVVPAQGVTEEERKAGQRRFEREARITALLTSPHTVTIYDYGVSDDGTFYSVMELLHGEDLQSRVAHQGPLSPEETVAVARQVCDSLSEAHERGLVHRDLKPANLFMAHIGTDQSFVKVLDFGFAELARHLSASTDASRLATVRVAGTPAYMPPETLLEKTVDARSDLYQLGCVMFFLLTGELVFDRPSVAALALAHVHDPAPLVSSRAQGPIPRELEAIIAICLQKNPADRFSSASELDEALADLHLGSPSVSPRRPHGMDEASCRHP